MRGSRSFETFRILLPGAVVLVLVDVAARFLGSLETTNLEPWSNLPSVANTVLDTVEDPFRAVVLAFALGLLLYWFDPAYGTPEYYKGIPSAYLRERLIESEVNPAVALSLYMHALNEKMNDALAERVLFMGAMYRVGFDTVFATFSMGILMAMVSALTLGHEAGDISPHQFGQSGGWMLAAAVLTTLFVFRTRPSEEMDWWPAIARAGLILALGTLGTALFVIVPSQVLANWCLVIGYLLALTVWTVFRLRGPEWMDWLQTIRTRGARNFVPSRTFELWEIALIDGALVLVGSLLMVAVATHLSILQLATPSALLLLAYVIAYQRRYERQLHGVYFNQQTWIDLNIDYLVQAGRKLAATKQTQAKNNS